MRGSFGRCHVLAVAIFAVVGLAGCATAPGTAEQPLAEWEVLGLDQVKRIADLRESMDEMHMGFRDVVVVRLAKGEEKERVDVASFGATYVGAQKDGAPAARTTLAISGQRDRLRLLTQDVARRTAFYREIPLTDLPVGRSFRFPVMQESGKIAEQVFTVTDVTVK